MVIKADGVIVGTCETISYDADKDPYYSVECTESISDDTVSSDSPPTKNSYPSYLPKPKHLVGS